MRVKTTLLAVAAVPIFLSAVAAQNLVINVNLRVLDFDVEEKGQPVLDLTADDLEVIEDGGSFPVTYLSMESDPVAFGLLVDRSSSIAPVRKTLEEAANDVLKAAGSEDQAFIVTFAGAATLRASITGDPKRIPQSVGTPKLQLGTRFYDVLVDSLDYLANESSLERKALVVVSDGADHFSRHTFEEALTSAVTYGYPIFVIGLVGDDPLTDTLSGREEVRSRLNRLASLTGGRRSFLRIGQKVLDS